jgi:hypothetical protein
VRFSNLFIGSAAACASTLFAGCGSGLQPSAAPSVSAAAKVRTSGMVPEAKRSDLLYISEYGGGVVDVFSFPNGKQVGTLNGFNSAQGECVDKKGDVFINNANINNGQPSIVEFAHGGTSPIATLSDNDQDPYGCAVDPRTGTLAVSNQSGKVALYQKAQGDPAYITDPDMALMLWCGYDNAGDLFVDGLNFKVATQLDEVPKGKTSFTPIQISGTIGFPGSIQWDGTHLTVEDAEYQGQDTTAIDQLQISGSSATIVGTTVLEGSEEVFEGWIAGKRLIGPEEGPSFDAVDFWPYPAGGKSIKSLHKSSGFFDGVFGAVVSPAR